MRKYAALADQFELRQPTDEWRADLRAFPDQDEGFSVLKAVGKRIDILHMIIPDFHFVPGQLVKSPERSHGVVIIVEYGYFHEGALLAASMMKCVMKCEMQRGQLSYLIRP